MVLRREQQSARFKVIWFGDDRAAMQKLKDQPCLWQDCCKSRRQGSGCRLWASGFGLQDLGPSGRHLYPSTRSSSLTCEADACSYVLCLNRSNSANNPTANTALAKPDPNSCPQLHSNARLSIQRATAK